MANTDLLYETFQLYMEKAIQLEKAAKYLSCRRYYYLAAEQMLKIAQESTGEQQKSQLKRAKDIIEKADGLPIKRQDEKTNKEESIHVVEGKKIPLADSLAMLEELEGLNAVKKQIREWVDQITVFKIRKERGLPVPEMSYHLVFTGNPGTGKTTVARIVAQIYYAMGILSKGQLVEVSRSDLVAGYVGQTALKTMSVIDKAIGGVLFIDEAYSLTELDGNDFGKEAISTILKEMENKRDDFVVIAAGYEKEMKKFISSNSGLKSRFKSFIKFEDYTAQELVNIFLKKCQKDGYVVEEEAKTTLLQYLEKIVDNANNDFGNGRGVRNLYEKTISKQSQRLSRMDSPTNEDLMRIERADIDRALSN